MAKVSLRAYNQEIETMIDRSHLDEAIAHCRHILKTFPRHLETYRLLGKAYLEYKRHPEAADIFSRVLVAIPSDFVANVGMSIIRDEENRLDEAIWHMERAFETQPSNAAIQSELQRLYGRREGVQPPRIRMTRGALAHMYVQGELYPQAISEIKGVLKEDPNRHDMQVLLARAYYRSGLKNDAAEAASIVLRNNPYNLDANRVMVEILGADRPESVQAYRQRVVELDPYAAQVTTSVFLSNEVPDAAVAVEHLDWNGQPVGLQPDWQTSRAISLESPPPQDEQPDWLKDAFGSQASAATPQVSPFDAAPPAARIQEPADDIPDFLREAGWGKSTGAFDESKSAFAEGESAADAAPIEQGDLPDWVKAMAPQQQAETPEEEELPDWINKIGRSDLPLPSETSEQADWMKGLDATPSAADEQPDWMKGFEPTPASAEERPDWMKGLEATPTSAEEQPDWMKGLEATPSSAEEQPDWLKQLGETQQPPAAESLTEEPDWLKGFGAEPEAAPTGTTAGDLDWLDQLAQAPATQPVSEEVDFLSQPSEPFDAAPSVPEAESTDLFAETGVPAEGAAMASSSDDFDFLDPLGSQLRRMPASSSEEFDFLKALTPEPEQKAPAEPAMAASLGTTEEEQDDAFAWLESLAAKQGATEGLLTKPEERLEEEPDWVKQAKGMDVSQPVIEEPETVVEQPVASVEERGKSEREQDDSFAWLESLAAKQGATEGLLTKPEERREEAPEWVQQARTVSSQTPEEPVAEAPGAEEPPVAEPAADIDQLGTSERERDDSFAWLESLAAKQGASEGLLTKPEERPQEEPEWVRQAKDLGETPALTAEPVSEPAAQEDEIETWLRSLDGETTPAAEPQPTFEEKPPEVEPEEVQFEEPALGTPAVEAAADDTRIWLRKLEEETPAQEPVQGQPEWLKTEEDIPVVEPPLAAPAMEQPVTPADAEAWLESLEEEEAESVSSRDDTAIWLKSLDKLEKLTPEPLSPEPAQAMQPEELPAWMQDLEEQKQTEEAGEVSPPAAQEPEVTEWMSAIEQAPEPVAQDAPRIDTGGLPSWLRGLEEEEAERVDLGPQEDLPAWLRDETPETVTEPAQIEPTRATDWQPVEMEASQPEPEPVELEPAPVASIVEEPVAPPPQPEVMDVVSIIEEKIAAPEPEPEKPAPPKPVREPAVRKVTGGLTDPVLGQARGELSRNNISGALENYGRLIKKGRLLEDIIYDLREALYRYPVDVDVWQSLGDAYMRSNRLQDALDAYTKAEELLR